MSILTLIFALFGTSQTAFANEWDAYLAEFTDKAIQPNCMPRKYEAQGEKRGAVMLHHGFTACPQQFFETAERLSDNGFTVYVSLLPGHGRKWKDNTSPHKDIPKGRKAKRQYEAFAAKMNAVMAQENGVRILGGLSVGGAVAINATLSAPLLYDRTIVITPFITTSTETHFWLPTMMDFLSFLPFTGGKTRGWGENCEVLERNGGRAGTCHFTIDQIAGLQQYGRKWLKRSKKLKGNIQLVGVEKDPTVSNKKIVQLKNRLENSGNKVDMCLYPYPSNHSLLSRFDSPNEDKFWIDDVHEKIFNFIVNNQTFPNDICMKKSESGKQQ